MPSALAAALRVKPGACVGAQTVALPSLNCTVQFIGSMVAWARNGTRYSASMVLADDRNAAATSPSFSCALPGLVRSVCERRSIISALERLAAGPWSHSMASAFTARIAWYGVSAITATPPGVLPVPMSVAPTGSSAITLRTPGSFCAAVASKLATRPPVVGHIAMLAYSRPGGSTSRPKVAEPSSLAAPSTRRAGWPMSLKSAGFFSATCAGSGCCAAFGASSPKVALLPLAW